MTLHPEILRNELYKRANTLSSTSVILFTHKQSYNIFNITKFFRIHFKPIPIKIPPF